LIHLKTIVKYFVFVTGIFLMGMGVSLITKSDLGTTPISSVPYVLSMIFPLTLGYFTFLLSILFLFIEIVILRRDFPKEQYLQLMVGPLFGLFIDLGMSLLAPVSPSRYAVKAMVLLLGCFVLAAGVYLQVAANVIVNPGEGVVKTIAQKTGARFGNMKIVFDLTLFFSAAMISLCAFGSIKGLREGTVISAVLVGYITKVFSTVIERFDLKNHVLSLCGCEE
jgi:uncharacterized membrane protein YczE